MIRPAWLAVAEQEAAMGVVEVTGEDHHPRIVAYHQATTLQATADEVPWCASFVGWCLRQAGVAHMDSARARAYLGWGVDLGLDARAWAHGAVVVLRRGGPDEPGADVVDAPGHVGFLVGAPTPDEILLLGGNQANAVNVRPYPRERLLAVRWTD